MHRSGRSEGKKQERSGQAPFGVEVELIVLRVAQRDGVVDPSHVCTAKTLATTDNPTSREDKNQNLNIPREFSSEI